MHNNEIFVSTKQAALNMAYQDITTSNGKIDIVATITGQVAIKIKDDSTYILDKYVTYKYKCAYNHYGTYCIYVTGFAKTCIVHTSNFSTLKIHKICYAHQIGLKFYRVGMLLSLCYSCSLHLFYRVL